VVGQPGGDGCYYYIDDVCLVPLGGNCGIPVSVAQAQAPSAFSAYPNPLDRGRSDVLRLSKPCNVTVYGSVGQFIGHFENTAEIDAGTWPSGVYWLRSEDGDVVKVIVME